MSNLVEVARFYDPEEAYCAKGYLQSCGVDTIIQNENHLSTAPWLRIALGGYRLLALSEFQEEAKHALDVLAANEADPRINERKEDGSTTDREYPSKRNWFWLPIAFLLEFPFLLRYKSKRELFFQSIFMVFGYAVIIWGLYNWIAFATRIGMR